MNTFTASNGLKVILTNAGSTGYTPNNDQTESTSYLGFAEMVAWREFFRAEEDERLGRVRMEGFPGLYAYRYNSGWINVVDEHDGTATEHRRQDVDACRDQSFVSESERFARAYFDAHPEPKPWHDAKPGEVWVLRIPTGPTFDHAPAVVSSSANGNVIFTAATYDAAGTEELVLTASQITYATRIWPEVAS